MKPTFTALAASLALLVTACNAQTPTEPTAHAPVETAIQPVEQAPPAEPAATPAAPKLQADLRALWHGHRIAVHIAASAPGPGVDTPEDLQRVRQLMAANDSSLLTEER